MFAYQTRADLRAKQVSNLGRRMGQKIPDGTAGGYAITQRLNVNPRMDRETAMGSSSEATVTCEHPMPVLASAFLTSRLSLFLFRTVLACRFRSSVHLCSTSRISACRYFDTVTQFL